MQAIKFQNYHHSLIFGLFLLEAIISFISFVILVYHAFIKGFLMVQTRLYAFIFIGQFHTSLGKFLGKLGQNYVIFPLFSSKPSKVPLRPGITKL